MAPATSTHVPLAGRARRGHGLHLTLVLLVFAGVLFLSLPMLGWFHQSAREVPGPAPVESDLDVKSNISPTAGSGGMLDFYQVVSTFSEKTSVDCRKRQQSVNFCPQKPCSKSGLSSQGLNHYVIHSSRPIPLVRESGFFYRFEHDLLTSPRLENILDTTSPSLSTLTLLSGQLQSDVINCSVGDVIELRADLRDGHGRARTKGLDDVRAWMVETQTAGGHPRRASGEVIDFNNGSYHISYRCLWPSSSSRLNVAVAYPREYLRRVLQMKRDGHYRLTAAKFSKGPRQEMTPCFATPNFDWPCLCNLTNWNNASFYCGAPRDPGLTCSDIDRTTSLGPANAFLGATSAETKLMKSVVSHVTSRRLGQVIHLHTGGNKSLSNLPLPACTSSRLTWLTPKPTGYFDKDKNWRTLLCTPFSLSKEKLGICLRNMKVWIFGDSNGVRLKSQFLGLLSSVFGVRPKCVNRSSNWNSHSTCQVEKLGLTLTFDPHEYHLYLGANLWPVYRDGGVAHHLDTIPATGGYVVIVHYFLHLQTAHLVVSHNRLMLFKEAIVRTLARNPRTVFALRGPHVMSKEWELNHSLGGDTQSLFYKGIIMEVFKDIMDNVIFLDGWDMSIAIENDNFHPTDKIPEAMVRILLSFVCQN